MMDILLTALSKAFVWWLILGIAYGAHQFATDWSKAQAEKGAEKWKIYLKALWPCVILAAIAWATHGAVYNDADADPLFGGGVWIQDHPVTTRDRHVQGLFMFFISAIVILGGVAHGIEKGRWARFLRKHKKSGPENN